jgi:hypothetical protein
MVNHFLMHGAEYPENFGRGLYGFKSSIIDMPCKNRCGPAVRPPVFGYTANVFFGRAQGQAH